MTPTKLRVLISGLLLLCLFPPMQRTDFPFRFLFSDNDLDQTRLILFGIAFVCAVHLWPARIKS